VLEGLSDCTTLAIHRPSPPTLTMSSLFFHREEKSGIGEGVSTKRGINPDHTAKRLIP